LKASSSLHFHSKLKSSKTFLYAYTSNTTASQTTPATTMADDDWTFVPRKKQGKAPKTRFSSTPPVSIKDATLDSIAKEFGTKGRLWKHSEARKQLHRMLALMKPDAGWQLDTAVCLGTGSFNRDNFECRKRTMEQFAMFVDTLEYLQEQQEEKIKVVVQEGYYNDLDKKFLGTMGMEVPEYEPHVYPILDCGPATKLFGPRTFVCELFIEHTEGTIRALTQKGVKLLMSTSRMMCTRGYQPGETFKQGDHTRLLSAIDKTYRAMRFPYFEEDPNVFEGLDILAPELQEEDD
jgi:hypothetical protein